MCLFRIIYRTGCLLATCIVFTAVGVALRLLFSRNRKKLRYYVAVFTRYWARCFCFFLNVHIDVVGERAPVDGGALIVSNHVGSPDIYVLSSCFKAVYVSKDEIKTWPLIGWLTRLGDTVFVDRSKRRQAPVTIAEIQDRLEDECSVIIFPEGGATDGADVLPFKPALFQAAIRAKRPVLPVTIRYRDSNTPSIACWYKMSFSRHMLALLRNAKLEVAVCIHPEIREAEDRRALADESRRQVRAEYQKLAPHN